MRGTIQSLQFKLHIFEQLYEALYLLEIEIKILEALKGMPFVAELHYAWREGLWLFLVSGKSIRNLLTIRTKNHDCIFNLKTS